jgi:serine protease Do
VRYRFATKALGGKVKLSYLRNGKTLETEMALESPPETPPADKTVIKGRNPFAGATVANISPAIADELALDSLGASGVVILKIEEGSTADQIQFQPGDIIVAVGQDKIASVKALKAVTAGTRQQWDFAIKRGERTFKASVGG